MRRVAAFLTIAMAIGGCGGGGDSGGAEAARSDARCREAADRIAKLPPPETGSALRRVASRTARIVDGSLGAEAKEASAALRAVAEAPPRDPVTREIAVIDVEDAARRAGQRLGRECGERAAAGAARLREAHYRLSTALLARSVDLGKVRLDEEAVLADDRHVLYATHQYKGAIGTALEAIQGLEAPPAAAGRARAYVRELRALARANNRLYIAAAKRRDPSGEAAALKRQAARAERALERLRAAV